MPDSKTLSDGQAQAGHAAACCCHQAASRAAAAAPAPGGGTSMPPRQDVVRVSVVVPTCGRPQLLQRCLASLMVQQFAAQQMEIIVVDDALLSENSDPPCNPTRTVVVECSAGSLGHGPDIRYLPPLGPAAPHGPAAARNRGWRSARGTVIAFTDDDTQARADWLACGMAAFSATCSASGASGTSAAPAAIAPAREVDAVWGRITMPLHGPASDYELDAKGLERAEFVTANCFCKRSLLEQIDGFDERFRLAWREDADLYFRLLEQGRRILHVPAAVVVHPIRPAGWGVSLQQQRKILFDALLFKKHPARYRQKIRATPRWDYYLIVSALLTAVVSGVAGASALAVAALLLWLVLTLQLVVRRVRPAIKTPSHVLEMIVTSALIPPLAVFWRMVGVLRFRVAFL